MPLPQLLQPPAQVRRLRTVALVSRLFLLVEQPLQFIQGHGAGTQRLFQPLPYDDAKDHVQIQHRRVVFAPGVSIEERCGRGGVH